ncbi:NYN domain-containing protein [Oceanisphaera pacifica]|uniref:NYN domain-containing protein n=1 Tax=Oceanisphaera pacifica TaxID=2818389 RepID=A0ABS3NDI6_9GAMM|nr:NYN domain-containing protein [Oceanisphaera pacifica]MBO1518651.1 NYN domain-containing protein [Oceanisphaera pacifica]
MTQQPAAKERVAIFVDVQNMYYTCRQTHNRNFDYNAFWAKVSAQRTVVAAYAYAIDRQDEKQRQFQHILRAIGFEVKLKPFIQRSDGTAKGDWDVGITIDMLECAAIADTLVLVSGDGDFAILIDKLRQHYAKRVEVYGVPALTAKALMEAADQFIAIDDALLL